ncbi:MAG: biotin--[acetyl-CoA-carboxylase] ligase [bacterium]|nr:biotin--[acetyl-CoA-carboxylase] ligase [bacterium]
MNNYPGFLEIINLESCDSTNRYLKDRYGQLKEKLPVLVTSDLQTGGRGREQRIWVSLKGKGLYSSLGFYLDARQNLNLLPLISGIAVIETLNRLSGMDFTLKWPNDVLYKNKKIAGILIENVIMETRLFCVAGIGINLNHSKKNFPAELADKATSLKMVTDSRENYPVEKVNPILADVFFQWLDKLEKEKREEIIQTAGRYSEFLRDKAISFHHLGRVISGIFKGIHHDGGLILGSEDGGTTIHYSGEIV